MFKNSTRFETLQRRFYGAHIEQANGSNQENSAYIRKEGRWQENAKHETNLLDTFEEWGELPPDRSRTEMQAEQILRMIREGKTNAEILLEIPNTYNKLVYIEQARQTFLQDKFKNDWRSLDVPYLWGDTGAGKTHSVMDPYGYANVFQVTNYEHPFDGYAGQDGRYHHFAA